MRLCLPQLGEVAISEADEPTAQPGVDSHPDNMKDLERRHILETLKAVGGSRKLAVERLGISERTLRYKLQQYRSEGMDV